MLNLLCTVYVYNYVGVESIVMEHQIHQQGICTLSKENLNMASINSFIKMVSCLFKF